jgi:hypothetical protein
MLMDFDPIYSNRWSKSPVGLMVVGFFFVTVVKMGERNVGLSMVVSEGTAPA